MPYRIEYSPDAEEHMRTLTSRQQAIILETVERQLTHQPTTETRNRKPMRPNPVAPWELRIGNLRVYSAARNPGLHVRSRRFVRGEGPRPCKARGKFSALPAGPTERGGPPPLLGLSPRTVRSRRKARLSYGTAQYYDVEHEP